MNPYPKTYSARDYGCVYKLVNRKLLLQVVTLSPHIQNTMETTDKHMPEIMETIVVLDEKNQEPIQGDHHISLHDQKNKHLEMTPSEEKAILRRIDLWIIPYCSL